MLIRPSIAKLIPVAAWGLTLLCPAVPAGIWVAIFNAINNGDIEVAALEAFCALHGIKAEYSTENGDFPTGKNGEHKPMVRTPNNLNR